MDQNKKPSRLEKTEQSLYSPNSDIRMKKRKKLIQQEYDLPNDWEKGVNGDDGENPLKADNKKGMGIFTKVLISALIFFIGALGYAFFIFNIKSEPAAQEANISINAPVSVAAGEAMTFDIIVENNNVIDMESIDLIIEYPEGTRDGNDVSESLPRERTDIGGIVSGSFQRETRTVFLFGEEGESKDIEVKVVYRVPDSNAVFEKRKVFDIVLKSTPIRMNVASVKEITSGQEVAFDVEIISNSNEDLDNILIKADYPFGFDFSSSSLPTTGSNALWEIEKLSSKETVKFTVKGEMQGQNNELKYFKFDSGIMSEDKEDEIGVLFTSIGKTIAIQRPFLEIDLAINRNNSGVINLDSQRGHEMQISYKNNTSEPIRDVEVILKLEGEVLDKESVRVQGGFYNSGDNTIRWDKSTRSEFDELYFYQNT